jgi:hypothetical protein
MMWRIAEALFGLFLGAGLIVCLCDWIRGRCRVPKAVHVLALILLLAGTGVAAYLRSALGSSPRVVVLWVALPPLWAYVGWLLMFGPWVSDGTRDMGS